MRVTVRPPCTNSGEGQLGIQTRDLDPELGHPDLGNFLAGIPIYIPGYGYCVAFKRKCRHATGRHKTLEIYPCDKQCGPPGDLNTKSHNFIL
jgi:hypothetical protein